LRRLSPQCPHIACKRGIFHYRRRYPGRLVGEVLLSLKTTNLREAEHRARLVGAVFEKSWERALAEVGTTGADLGSILREYLREALERDLAGQTNGSVPMSLLPLGMLEACLADTRDALADRDPRNVRQQVDALIARHGLPEDVRHRLGVGVLEVQARLYEEAIRRARGEVPLVLAEEAPFPASAPAPSIPAAPRAKSKPLASTLIEPHFAKRATTAGISGHTINQERTTLRMFLEVAGDLPVDTYNRGHVSTFLDTMRRMPATYGRSPKDRNRTVADLIAEADEKDAPRLADKTVKRHLSAVSTFWETVRDAGHITVSQRAELVSDHRFRAPKGAREQREAWTSEELVKLFSSPIWTGCHPYFRTQQGTELIRDAKFWLPLLALFHGARLEEFADMRGRDLDQDDGTWRLHITTVERRLKNDNAKRIIPLHPELVRLGFPQYVADTAPNAAAPLFPDLEPQGPDRKRGPRITRWFGHYRRAIGVYREDVAMHAFRHTAITHLRNVIQTAQQERHVDFLMGHARGGGEGRERYDKGPGLKARAETLGLLAYPELNFSRLYGGT
jgi:integrase